MKPAILALVFASLVSAAENPVAWTVKAPSKAVANGQKTTLLLVAEIKPGWHLYALDLPEGGPIPTEISLASGQPFELAGAVEAPKAHSIFDPNFNMQVAFYIDKAEFKLPVKVGPGTPPGKQTVVVEARYQTCNDKLCLPPKTVHVESALQIRGH